MRARYFPSRVFKVFYKYLCPTLFSPYAKWSSRAFQEYTNYKLERNSRKRGGGIGKYRKKKSKKNIEKKNRGKKISSPEK